LLYFVKFSYFMKYRKNPWRQQVAALFKI